MKIKSFFIVVIYDVKNDFKRFCEDVKLEQVLNDSSISFAGFAHLHLLLLMRLTVFIDKHVKYFSFNLMKVLLLLSFS